MGRGNVCTTGRYEGLYFIDNDHIQVYRRLDDYGEEPETRLAGDLTYEELTGPDWCYDEEGTMCEEDDILECLMSDFLAKYPSFSRCGLDEWRGDVRLLMESKLFYIGVEDNQWSLAVKLLQKEEPWGDVWMENLQGRLYQTYLRSLRDILLDRLPSIGLYSGAWTHKVLTREEASTGVT